jgi:hypothetical protein
MVEVFVKLREVLYLTDTHRVSGNKMRRIKIFAVKISSSDLFCGCSHNDFLAE